MFTSWTFWSLWLLMVCLVLSSFFSSSEVAFLSAQRVRLRHMVGTGVRGAKRAANMVEHPERLLPIVLLGNNLANTAAAALGTVLMMSLMPDHQGMAVVVATVVVTSILLVFGDTVPKIIGAKHAERLALLFVLPLEWIEKAFFPLSFSLRCLSRWVGDVVGGKSRSSLITEEEIKVLISVGKEEGAVRQDRADMLDKVFRFSARRVNEVMTPRPEAIWVAKGTSLKEFLNLYIQHSHTRFPVVEDGIDNVVGILSVKDVVRAMARENLSTDAPVTGALRPVFFVPETKLAGDLFADLQGSGNQMAVVVDEFGGVAGLVTLKQLAEEIVGPGGEEAGEPDEQDYRAIGERIVEIDGDMRLEEANEKLGLGLPDGEYETVAGFVLSSLGHIPSLGESIDYAGQHLVVTRMKGVKIEQILVENKASKQL
jgi:putative hemolysin